MADEKDPNAREDSSFRVIDRRLFTASGELRPEALERERAEAQAEAARPAASNPAPAPNQSPAPAAPTPEAPRPLRGFQQLISFLAQNAVAMLGGYPDPRTGQAYLDLAGARELLDMLEALREKARGNLAPDEEKVLVEVIGSLKLSYLEAQQATSQALREKARGKP